MSNIDSSDDKFKMVTEAAKRILDVYGHAAPGTSQVVYSHGDLSIAGDTDILEIIYRGTLVFRCAPAGASGDYAFQDEGDWIKEVEQIAQAIPDLPSDKVK